MGKGGDFEREVSRTLSLWWTENQRDDIFWRSDSSGARFTQRKKTGKDTANQGGDITFSDSLGEQLIKNWNIEAKTGYAGRTKVKDSKGNDKVILNRWDVLDILDSSQKEPVLLTMWNQCKRDAELTNREPVLIFRRNGRKPCIMFTAKYLCHLFSFFGMTSIPTIMIVIDNKSHVIFNLQDFFNWIPNIKGALK
jgi:hypothetical protein